MTPLTFLDPASVVVFALTGALVASRAQLDIVGFAFIACLTAVGGGTVRDLLLDRHPVFWIETPSLILWAVASAVAIFFTAHLVESRLKWVVWLDSFALAVAVPAGVAAAVETGQHPVVVVLMGMATGSLGGLMRDVVCNEVPLVLKQGELYISCAMFGAISALVSLAGGAELTTALLVCAGVTWGLRAGSIAFGWHLPVYKSRPPGG
ncbi:trimeric intracellular cation channel family protein [Epibacterium sp. SM1979]|uniref:Trimeric intracellular cation channel family protein n=1 Tax=Tritonibacter litoralis TaxID=2662264 RepID=A0A843YBJ2_9RHOB|nr:trimeric intracellular cation channel family protein [Tritonibacter litoralis]MQQ08660.1 trimeric intracellular cation channel family protein [Tritonibacter litoralis]